MDMHKHEGEEERQFTPTLDSVSGLEKVMQKEEEVKRENESEKTKTKEPRKSDDKHSTKSEKDERKFLSELACDVLCPHEVLRDSVHGDIWITLIDRAIIDTPLFQKLRGKLQLGPTHLVYFGATHTRFAHSIGTLHMAEKIIEICNKNYKKFANPYLMEIDPYDHLLIRLYALLHDAAHIPFGHTLEREGNLFPKHEWEDKVRAEKIIGNKSKIREAINETLKLFHFSDKQIKTVIDDLYEILTYDRSKDPMNFRNPFVIDVVGNTLCADLLDYSVRDMYYCGLTERWGNRFLQYLAILPLVRVDSESEEYDVKTAEKGGKGRLVLLSYRYERDRSNPRHTRPVHKHDVISEAIDLLRKRFSLAQKVYFHRTKKAASAMLISAVGEEGLKPEDLLEMNCDQLIVKLTESTNVRVKNIAQNYRKRNLFKVIYEIKYKKPAEDENSRILWKDIAPKFRNSDLRLKKEREIEKTMDLGLGNLLIYCPRPGMNVKQIEMLVQTEPENQVKPLRLILDETRKEELEVIDKYFNKLWSLQVLINPDKLDPREVNNPDVRCLSGYCEDLFGLPNDLNKELRGTRRDLAETRIHVAVKDWDQQHPDERVPNFIVEKLKAESHRYTKDPEALKKELQEMVKEHYDKS